MDVTGWSIEQRMRLPDYCFGQQQLVIAGATVVGPGVLGWDISELYLPEHIGIWEIGIYPRRLDDRASYVRFGLLYDLPINAGQMDAAIVLTPYWGWTAFTPPRVFLAGEGTTPWNVRMRRGIPTEGARLVLELFAAVGLCSVFIMMIFSELPTDMAGFQDHGVV